MSILISHFDSQLSKIAFCYDRCLLKLDSVRGVKVRGADGKILASFRVRRLKGRVRVYAVVRGRESSSLKHLPSKIAESDIGREFRETFAKARALAEIINKIEENLKEFRAQSKIIIMKTKNIQDGIDNRIWNEIYLLEELIRILDEIDRRLELILKRRYKTFFIVRSSIDKTWGVLRIDICIKSKNGKIIAVRDEKGINRIFMNEVDNSKLSQEKRNAYMRHLYAMHNSIKNLINLKKRIINILRILDKTVRYLENNEVATCFNSVGVDSEDRREENRQVSNKKEGNRCDEDRSQFEKEGFGKKLIKNILSWF